MSQLQSKVENVVIAFRPRAASVSTLSWSDRMDVLRWQDQVRAAGYDRMVVHERDGRDPPEVGTFLSIYRKGEPWARWCMARLDGALVAWCSKTGADLGRFKSVTDALRVMLPGSGIEAQSSDGSVRFLQVC